MTEKTRHTISKALLASTTYRVMAQSEFMLLVSYLNAQVLAGGQNAESIRKALVQQTYLYANGDKATPMAILKNLRSQIVARVDNRGRLTAAEEELLAYLDQGVVRQTTGDVIYGLLLADLSVARIPTEDRGDA